MSALGLAPLSAPGTADLATGIASVARRANDAADVVWFGPVGPAPTEKLVAAQMHNDSAGAGAMWSGSMLPKRSGRQGWQCISALSPTAGQEQLFYVATDGTVVYQTWTST
jgi:hypothetical protein